MNAKSSSANSGAEKKSRGHDRTRLWAAFVYPESAPPDWRDILDSEHIEWCESPLHEFDVDETSGALKKAHYHIVLSFDGPKSFEQVCSILEPLHNPIPQRCHSLRGAVRYMAHLDNPDKFQYDPGKIISHGGFDVAAALAPSSGERYDMISEMRKFIHDNGITEFQDLFDYAAENHRQDWFPLLCDNSAYVLNLYIKSQRHRKSPSSL